MRYPVLASDYDETLARQGQLADTTIKALEHYRSSGGRALLITGRELADLRSVCKRLDLFDQVVAENGAILYDPRSRRNTALGLPPPPCFIEELLASGVTPLSQGQVIVSTLRPFDIDARRIIERLELPFQVVLNREAVMILPEGVDKASGLRRALETLDIPFHQVCAVGDAENDLAFLNVAALPAAVANALPSVKRIARFVSGQEAGPGVEELIRALMTDKIV